MLGSMSCVRPASRIRIVETYPEALRGCAISGRLPSQFGFGGCILGMLRILGSGLRSQCLGLRF